MQPNYYDFNVRFPIYETNILNLTNVKHPDADFSLHENLERMILETGDEMKKSTNVKADMTNWTMHKTHTGFKQLADMVMSIAGQLTKTKPPLGKLDFCTYLKAPEAAESLIKNLSASTSVVFSDCPVIILVGSVTVPALRLVVSPASPICVLVPDAGVILSTFSSLVMLIS